MTDVSVAKTRLIPRAFWIALLGNIVWMNISETFRYFAFVMPMVRAAFPEVPNVAPMSPSVFMMWGLWDTILIVSATGAGWLLLERFGTAGRVTVAAATALWLAIFGILWLALYNMRLATPPTIALALPLAWVEIMGAMFIVRWAMTRDSRAARK